MKNKTFWKFAIQTAISVLSAIATALGVTSCMAYKEKSKKNELGKLLGSIHFMGCYLPYS